MSKFRIEVQITLLTIIIGIVVVTIGYFSYKSLSNIVYSIHEGTIPDSKIFIIKDIDSDLAAAENTVRLYSLTNSYDNLEMFYSLKDSISQNFKKLSNLKQDNQFDLALIDSIIKLSQEKLNLWNEILNIYLSSEDYFPAFSKIYSNLQKQKSKPALVENEKNVDEKNAELYPSAADQSLEQIKIRIKLLNLERELNKKRERINNQQSQLFERNVIISGKINQLIREAETRGANELLKKAAEADRLANVTYKRLAFYSISAVMLLFIVLFVLFNYLKKTRAAEHALADTRKKAETLAIAKEQFAANVSHELRTPVNAIYGLTEQVLQGKLDSKTSEMISVIFKSAGHLKNIVNDTLDFSKIQSGNIVFESKYFSPGEIFEEVYALFKYEASMKDIALKFNWEEEKPEILIGDPLRLKQIIINLVGNAIKFTEKGEVTLNVKGFKLDAHNFEIEIQVIDTGIGIEEDKLDIVFDEYVQIENRTGKKYNGTGLGLSIVKKLVELQGGKIKLESKQGIGTKATVIIGYRLGEPVKVEQARNEILEIPESFRQLSVLIADDEEFNLFLLKSILQKWGIQFKEAKNGNEAINTACKEHFDLILMDINMPEMNGIEAAKSILSCTPDIKIVAVSAATDQFDQQACFNAGMKGFLSKPYAENDLFEMINSLNQGKSYIRQPIDLNSSVDISGLRHLSGNDPKFLVEMIQLFMKSMKSGISNIESAIENEKWNEVAENAHKMAAPVKHMGASQLYKKIKNLEKISEQSVSFGLITPAFGEIKNEIIQLNILLKSYIDELKP